MDSERRDIVRWLITEKGAPVNQVCKHETALLRAIYRNNELIVKDLLELGADMEHRREVVNWNMPIEAVMRNRVTLFDVMLEHGASLEFKINGKIADAKLIEKGSAMDKVRIKHQRWRRLRQFLKLEEQVGTNTT